MRGTLAAYLTRSNYRGLLFCSTDKNAPLIVPIYAGYLTPPGVGAYWVDCWYFWYVAYICCNGFSLVFSVAAIAAVLMGPIVLVCLGRSTWRKRIAILAITHLALSLLSLVAAFASAGFVTASVNPPDLNCGNLKCKDGGVPCSAYTMRRSNNIYAQYNNRTKAYYGVGTYNESSYTDALSHSLADFSKLGGVVSIHNNSAYEFVLDPVVARLNNDAFGDAHTLEIPRNDVVCRDCRYIAKKEEEAQSLAGQLTRMAVQST